MKVYELMALVNFLVMLIVVCKKGNPFKTEDSFIEILWMLFSTAFFIAAFLFWIENNINWNFLTYQVF